MTEQEALLEAQRRWGSKGKVYDRASAPEIEWRSARFWVGAPDGKWDPDAGHTYPYGNGDSWEDAFADADLRDKELTA